MPMLLSLDGKMVVKMETSVNLTVGQSVKVVLSSGSSVDGTVTKSEDESCTITVTDKGTKYNDKVTAYTSSGTKIGTGKLNINKEVKVTATSGTVSSVLVSENEYVSEGDQLIKLKGDFQSEKYLTLESQKEDLEEKLASLLKIAKNNTITADSAGIITEVNISEDTESGSSSDSSSSNSSTSSAASSSATGSSGNSGVATGTSATGSSKRIVSTLKNSTKTVKAVNLSTNGKVISETSKKSVSLCSTGTTENVSRENIDSDNEETTENSSETTEVKNNEVNTDTTEQKSEVSGSNNSSSTTQTNGSQTTNNSGNNSSSSAKTDKNTDNTKNTTKNKSGNKNSVKSSGQSGTMNGTGKSNTGGMSGVSGTVTGGGASGSATSGNSSVLENSSSTSTSSDSEINTELASAVSIASGDEMMLSVNVDEMDILSIETGQKATITFDAIEDKEYEGKITSIDKNGTTSSGTTKYPVEITVAKEDTMMAGMILLMSIQRKMIRLENCLEKQR